MAYRPSVLGASGTPLEGIIQALVHNQPVERDNVDPGWKGPEVTYRPLTEELAEAGYVNPQHYRDSWEEVQPLTEEFPDNADLQIWRDKLYPLPDRFYDEDYSTMRDPARGHPGYGTDQQQVMNPGTEGQVALSPGEGGGPGNSYDLHSQIVGPGWEGPWTPAVDPAMLALMIRRMMELQQLPASDPAHMNWFAGR